MDLPPCDQRILYVDHDGDHPGPLGRVRLFDFDTRVNFRVCADGTVRIANATDVGTVRYGKTTQALALLGYEIDYKPAGKPVAIQVSARHAQVDVNGTFYVRAKLRDILVSVLTLGLGRLEADLSTRLSQALSRVGAKEPRRVRIIAREIGRTIARIRRDIDLIDKRLVARGVPKPLAEFLEDVVEEPIELLLKQAATRWNESVSTLVGQSTEVILKALSGKCGPLNGGLLCLLPKASDFPVWTPEVRHDVYANGGVLARDEGWKNPSISVRKVRQSVKS